jgi:hypothetical protein
MIMFFLVPVWIVGILGSFCLLFFRPLRPFAFPIGFSVVLTLPFAFAALIGTLYAAQNLFHLHISSGYGPAAAELIVLLLVSGIGGCVGLLAGFGLAWRSIDRLNGSLILRNFWIGCLSDVPPDGHPGNESGCHFPPLTSLSDFRQTAPQTVQIGLAGVTSRYTY